MIKKLTNTKKKLINTAYYYFVKEDYNQSKLYWNKILEIDPGNETATKALGGIK